MPTEISKKILITGGNGYVANSCIKYFNSIHQVDVVTRKDFDLTNTKDVINFFDGKHYDVVLHTAITGGSRLQTDSNQIVYSNLLMFENLLNCQKSFDKLISFGSGAEIWAPETPYGLSKKIINRIIQHTPNVYNIRIYGVFDENELPTRFIKSCIQKCKNNEYIDIFQNKFFDFFYMQDLLNIVDCYIKNKISYKLFECSYIKKYTLYDIAKYICNIYNKDWENFVHVKDTALGVPYIGKAIDQHFVNFIGLEKGIDVVSKHL